MTLEDGLSGWWDATLDDTFKDLSVNGVDLVTSGGTINSVADSDSGGTTCWQPAVDTASALDPNTNPFYGAGGTGDFAAVVWVRGSTIGSIVSQRDLENAPNKGWVIYQSSGFARFLCQEGSAVLVTGTVSIVDSEWHCIVAQRTGGNIEIYTDGGDRQVTAFSGNITNPARLFFWRQEFQSSPYSMHKNDTVRCYDRALTSDEITELYTGGRGYAPTPTPSRTFHPLQQGQ